MIQETPKSSEKLYILDSIDVPLSELNKYRHLSVVNKLPDNIILPPPPPLRHETNGPNVNVNVNVPTKLTDGTNSNRIQSTKNDFEANVDYDVSDLVETKNMLTIQNVKKVFKKQRGKREQMRTKTKNTTNNPHISNEHSSDLSTPLRSLSPAHDFDVEMASAVDLSVNSKEIIDEFIDNLSICSEDSESGYDLIASPLSEYLQLTEPQPLVMAHKNEVSKEQGQHSPKNCDKINENEQIKEREHNETEIKQRRVSLVSIETLQNICINTFNTEKFRSYFTETVINAPIEEDTVGDISNESKKEVKNIAEKDDKKEEEKEDDNGLLDNSNSIRSSNVEVEEDESVSIQQRILIPPPSHLSTLRQLAMNAVLINQFYMSSNLKPFKNILELESERKGGEVGCNAEPSVQRIRTLQELAREVAVTIYSFNVKPLQDICRLAIDKFSQMYSMNRYDATEANPIPEILPSESITSNSLIGMFLTIFLLLMFKFSTHSKKE